MARFLFSETDPAHDLVAVTKSDTVNDPAGPFRGIILAGAGAVKVTTIAGTDRTIPTGVLAVGVIHAIRVKRVWTTGTTATDIWGAV